MYFGCMSRTDSLPSPAPSLSPDSLYKQPIIEKNKDFSAKRTTSNDAAVAEVWFRRHVTDISGVWLKWNGDWVYDPVREISCPMSINFVRIKASSADALTVEWRH